jgi:hypothetical protein
VRFALGLFNSNEYIILHLYHRALNNEFNMYYFLLLLLLLLLLFFFFFFYSGFSLLPINNTGYPATREAPRYIDNNIYSNTQKKKNNNNKS